MLSTGRLLQAGAVLSSGEVAGAASMGQLYAHCSCISNSGIVVVHVSCTSSLLLLIGFRV
jgi:hypothetical protein